MSLAWLERDAGYTGEMASARVWLRHQPFDAYISLIAPFAAVRPGDSSIAAEIAADPAGDGEPAHHRARNRPADLAVDVAQLPVELVGCAMRRRCCCRTTRSPSIASR